MREIARRLGRDPSTISRELRRNAATRAGKLEYRASVAQWKADLLARRPKAAKLVANERLHQYRRGVAADDFRAGPAAGVGEGEPGSEAGEGVPGKSRSVLRQRVSVDARYELIDAEKRAFGPDGRPTYTITKMCSWLGFRVQVITSGGAGRNRRPQRAGRR